MCKENMCNEVQAMEVVDKIPEAFVNNPDGYRIWLGFQEIMNLTQEEKDLLFEDDFVGGGAH